MMTLDEMRQVVENLSQERPVFFNIFGGEPLLRDDIVEIVDVIRQQFPQSQIALTTNASRLRQYGRALLERNVEVGISLDGISEEVNDAIRGKGTFRRTLDTLVWYLALRQEIGKIATRSWVSYTITRLSEEPADILRFFESMGADRIVLSMLSPQGSALRNVELFLDTGAQIDYLKRLYMAIPTSKLAVSTNTSLPLLTIYLNEQCAAGLQLSYSGCSVLSGNIYLRPNGVFTACLATYPGSDAFRKLGLSEPSLIDCRLEEILIDPAFHQMEEHKNPGSYPSDEPCNKCKFAGSYCDPCWINGYLGLRTSHAMCVELGTRLDAMQVSWRATPPTHNEIPLPIHR
jgi:MoaA/NifB/PqqE/SkfB family radical SAM enzyme